MPKAKQIVQSGFLKAFSIFFEYDTPKVVHIRSKKVGIINRIIQAAILAYIIGYAIVWEKGYQEIESVVSVSTTKLKGIVYTNTSKLPPDDPRNHRIWDVADYVIPAQENDAFFVATNIVVTRNQTQGKCPEDPGMRQTKCHSDQDCPEGVPILYGNGVRTGKCVPSSFNKSLNVCEIYAWCPVENDSLPLGPDEALLAGSKTFTVLIKNNIEFPKFNIKRRNILDSQNKTYLQSCHYNSSHPEDRFCPVFELGRIIEEAGENYEKMAVQGGVISITINWDCNLDLHIDYCKPEYIFRRLDPATAKIAQGFNFRFANYYEIDNVMARDLYKVYGLRFVIKTTGQAGKFSMVPLLLSLGSGLGLLAIATVLCDIVVMYVLKKGPFYRDKKYFYVTDDDAFQVSFNSDSDSDDSCLLGSDDQQQAGLLDEGAQPNYNTMNNQESSSQNTEERNIKKRKGNDSEDDHGQLID